MFKSITAFAVLASVCSAMPVSVQTSGNVNGFDTQPGQQQPASGSVVAQPGQQQPTAGSQLPALGAPVAAINTVNGPTGQWTSTGGGNPNRKITFKNSCQQPLKLKYKVGLVQVPTILQNGIPTGGSFDWVVDQHPKSALVFIGYLVNTPAQCAAANCPGWGDQLRSNGRTGPQWLANKAPAARCNPVLAMDLQANTRACCAPGVVGWDDATQDCPGIDDMGWGTHIEYTFANMGDVYANFDSLDISTNYKRTDGNNVLYNLPVGIAATQNNCNHQVQHVQQTVAWPWQCMQADCTTAYQSPTDDELNGSQLQCPGDGASYTVEFCPGGVTP